MSPSKHWQTAQDRRVQRRRLAAFVAKHDSTRSAAAKLGVDHTTLWRATKGHLARGAPLDLVLALTAYTGQSVDYWLGRGAEEE